MAKCPDCKGPVALENTRRDSAEARDDVHREVVGFVKKEVMYSWPQCDSVPGFGFFIGGLVTGRPWAGNSGQSASLAFRSRARRARRQIRLTDFLALSHRRIADRKIQATLASASAIADPPPVARTFPRRDRGHAGSRKDAKWPCRGCSRPARAIHRAGGSGERRCRTAFALPSRPAQRPVLA